MKSAVAPIVARVSTGIFVTLCLTALGTGCQHKADSVPASSAVTDVSAPSAAPIANYAPAQPVYDTAPAASSATPSLYASSTSAGGSYTIKKGDTFFGIARARYGDGKQWQKIAAANPGVTPQTLKVGQVITVP